MKPTAEEDGTRDSRILRPQVRTDMERDSFFLGRKEAAVDDGVRRRPGTAEGSQGWVDNARRIMNLFSLSLPLNFPPSSFRLYL
jgi:hypothetical protein